MLVLRHDSSISSLLFDGLQEPVRRATQDWPGYCEVFVYDVGFGSGPAREVMLRVSTGQSVVPILFRARELEPERIFVAVKGALARADL